MNPNPFAPTSVIPMAPGFDGYDAPETTLNVASGGVGVGRQVDVRPTDLERVLDVREHRLREAGLLLCRGGPAEGRTTAGLLYQA